VAEAAAAALAVLMVTARATGAALARLLPVRSRGFEYSSIPKLMRARPAPMMAMARPGGTNHHHAP
jgi:hypothetical protein